MAENQYTVKKITDLATDAEVTDSDLMAVGNAGTSILKKLTLGNFANYIRDKLKTLTFTGTNGLNTTSKTLPGGINELEANGLNYRGQFTGDADATDITPGIYYIGASGSADNIPTSITWGTFVQFPADSRTQVAISASHVYERTRTGSPAQWNAWRELIGLSNLSGLTQLKTYTVQYTISASSVKYLYAVNDFGMSAPTGYKAIGVLAATSGNDAVLIRHFSGSGSGAGMVVRNVSSSQMSATASITVLYIKSL